MRTVPCAPDAEPFAALGGAMPLTCPRGPWPRPSAPRQVRPHAHDWRRGVDRRGHVCRGHAEGAGERAGAVRAVVRLGREGGALVDARLLGDLSGAAGGAGARVATAPLGTLLACRAGHSAGGQTCKYANGRARAGLPVAGRSPEPAEPSCLRRPYGRPPFPDGCSAAWFTWSLGFCGVKQRRG
jgi:hypothetical protein